jgi:predicted membrane metal-binding protein
MPDDTRKIFWSSLVWGRSDETWGSRAALSRLFFDLGMIHVLVLSGSQVSSFFRLQQGLIGLALKSFSVSRSALFARAAYAGSWICLFVYVAATGSQPPLVRAFIALAVAETRLLGGAFRRAFVALMLHLAFFPEQAGSLSFVLSWCAFLFVLLVGEWGVSRMVALVLMCVLSQALVVFLKGGGAFGAFGWKTIAANLLFVPLFEAIVFPMGSGFALVAVGASFWGDLGAHEGILRRIFDWGSVLHGILAQVFLGALKGIRYI